MQVQFADTQKNEKAITIAAPILRTCVHCGMCAATCPSFLISGDERDSPRGRIYMIKSMMETAEIPGRDISLHLDRCLSCLNCMTTCPSDVNYMHLIDLARSEINKNHGRSLYETAIRKFLVHMLPNPLFMRLGLIIAKVTKPFTPIALLPKQIQALMRLSPKHLPSPLAITPIRRAKAAQGEVVLLQGCAQRVLSPGTYEAMARVLTRHGFTTRTLANEGCCGSLAHHMGEEKIAEKQVTNLVQALGDCRDIDAVIPSATGCGTTLKDYATLAPDDARAANIAEKARDFCQIITTENLRPLKARQELLATLRCVWHPPCSLQHGQKLNAAAVSLLEACGIKPISPKDSHLCCGSAGTYNILQPDFAVQLRDRKLANIAEKTPDVIITANIGCISQLASGTDVPIVHIAALVDWVSGGPDLPDIAALLSQRS
ncbi:MAG: glycolate oxidase subunit GlcF [Pseudomonadota bacterium]